MSENTHHYILCARVPADAPPIADKEGKQLTAYERRKRAAGKWKDVRPEPSFVAAHLKDGYLVGIVPASANVLLLDVDEGDGATILAECAARDWYCRKMRSGKQDRWHIAIPYACEHAYEYGYGFANGSFEIGEDKGEFRNAKGYAVIWDTDAWREVLEYEPTADTPSIRDLPQAFTELRFTQEYNARHNLAAAPKQARLGQPKPAGRGRGRPPKWLGTDSEWTEGKRNNTLNTKVYAAVRGGYPERVEAIAERAAAAGLSQDEIDATCASATEAAEAAGVRKPGANQYPDSDLLRRVLAEKGLRLRLNTRLAAHEYNGERATDHLESSLRDYIQRTYYRLSDSGRETPIRYSAENWKVATESITQDDSYDPVIEWLEALPEWDGEPRLHGLFTSKATFHADNTPLNRHAPFNILLGVVMRAYEPGAKLDEVVVLKGKQGWGKSALLANLLPCREWYSDNLVWNDTPQKQREALAGKAIVEAAEFAGGRKAEIDKMKAFITRGSDRGRRAYAKNPDEQPRRCVIVATTDTGDFLPNDPAGNRRFVVVTLKQGFEVEPFLALNRDQLWAEALHRYRAGETPRLPRELMQAQAVINERHRGGNPELENLVAEYGFGKAHIEPNRFLTWMREHHDGVPRPYAKALGAALRQAGYERALKRIEGVRKRIWIKPGSPATPSTNGKTPAASGVSAAQMDAILE